MIQFFFLKISTFLAQRLEDIYLEAHIKKIDLDEENIFLFIDFQIKTIFSKILLNSFEKEVKTLF